MITNVQSQRHASCKCLFQISCTCSQFLHPLGCTAEIKSGFAGLSKISSPNTSCKIYRKTQNQPKKLYIGKWRLFSSSSQSMHGKKFHCDVHKCLIGISVICLSYHSLVQPLLNPSFLLPIFTVDEMKWFCSLQIHYLHLYCSSVCHSPCWQKSISFHSHNLF